MMKLRDIQIHNYKSLRNIRLTPGPLSVFVGPNAAGKSNFVDALDFLGDVYGSGLESAIARKGGYENICYRRSRRSASPIRFQIGIEGDSQDFNELAVPKAKYRLKGYNLIFRHNFEFMTRVQAIQSPFEIKSEYFEVFVRPTFSNKLTPLKFELTRRDKNLEENFDISGLEKFSPNLARNSRHIVKRIQQLPETTLMSEELGFLFSGTGFELFHQTMAKIKLFQFDPHHCRETGVPTPNPGLDRFGGNLPAVIAHLKTNYPDQYALLLNTVRRVMPTFEDLETYYTPRKTLGLSVKEKSFGRPWVAEDVSDGTMQTIALLTAIFDPRIPIVIIEEPENSIHPWAIRSFIEAAREAARHKYIFLTTHSPTLIDQLKPDEVWIVSRPEAETKIDPLLDLDPSLAEGWEKGSYTLFEYLDSGMVSAAVPAA